jgi:hypothetical protein
VQVYRESKEKGEKSVDSDCDDTKKGGVAG